MDSYVRVLIEEKDPEIRSAISPSLGEIQECRVSDSASVQNLLKDIRETNPDLVLFSADMQVRDRVTLINEIHHKHPAIYLIVSLPVTDQGQRDDYVLAGAHDCLIKGHDYIANLVDAVKRTVIRISERKAFSALPLSGADPVSMDENLPDAIFSLDLEGKIVYVNRAVSSLLGYGQKDLMNSSFADLFSLEEARAEFQEYLSGVYEVIHFRKMAPLRDSLGIDEEFEISLTLMEGEMIYGVARKESLKTVSQPLEESGPTVQPKKVPSTIPADEYVPGRLGPYLVITLLGAGAMGRVYKGFDEQLERDVAIKIISRNDSEYVEQFQREARILASICHPNIALIYYLGTLEGLWYFCMEYLPGGSLESLLEESGKLDPETSVSFAIQVAMALKEALDKGVIHLDIKPSNLMIAEDNRIKVVDFGLAQRNQEKEKLDKSIIGTPLYLAPEQIVGGSIDYRCDIYSLGITFFQMLYGFLPFSATNTRDVFQRKLREDLPPRESLDSSVPEKFYELIQQMTTRNPAQRISDYSELIERLETARRTLFHPEPVSDIPPPIESAVLMRGNLHDTSFAEILGEIGRKQLSGKLTLSWIDLYKTLHFRDGKIIAVLSSQEGENFIDLVLGYIPGMKSKLPGGSSDLFHGYSTAMQYLSADIRERLFKDVEKLAWRILDGLFTWLFGEFMFEGGEYSGQMKLELDIDAVLDRGVRKHLDSGIIHRRLLNGKCEIHLMPDFQKTLTRLDLQPSDRFLLFRFENSIPFSELQPVSGISEEECFRLIYLFLCFGLIQIHPVQETVSTRKQEPVLLPAHKEQPAAAFVPEPQTAVPQRHETPKPSPPVTDLSAYYFQCAVKSYGNKNYWASVEYCKKALEHRADAKIYHLMGNALGTHPRFRHEAVEAFKRAQQMDPGNPTIEGDLADLYFATGNYALAKGRYDALLKLRPSDDHAVNRLQEIRKKKS